MRFQKSGLQYLHIQFNLFLWGIQFASLAFTHMTGLRNSKQIRKPLLDSFSSNSREDIHNYHYSENAWLSPDQFIPSLVWMWKIILISAHLQHLSSSSAEAPADTLHKDSAGPLPFALLFRISQNEHCPGKRKTHSFGATWSLSLCDNKGEKWRSRRS